jgi:hypothetical protein
VLSVEINKTGFTDQKPVSSTGKSAGKNLNELTCDRVEIGTDTEKSQKGFYELKDFQEIDKGGDVKSGSPANPDPNIIEATNANFDEIIKTSKLPVMVDFYNPG